MNINNFYSKSPTFIQNIMLSVYNILAYKKRYGGRYKEFRNKFLRNRDLTYIELKEIQNNKLNNFLDYSIENSEFYSNVIKDRTNPKLENFPILDKEVFRKNVDQILTIKPKDGIISKTGGTTGKSLTVYYTYENMQERFALLDDFRSRFGYELGQKTAWFSGKSLLSKRDIRKNRFWKTDFYHNVRYYSTFHIKNEYLKFYIEDLIKFQPKYFVGFPSTILEIARYGIKNKIEYPVNVTKAIFPTAETIVPEMRETIERFFKSKMYNQYASSEGAPFIIECEKGNLHLELQSGVFEVLDEHNQPAQSGKLVVTSFTTEGTPLIRYDIGDSITLADSTLSCSCGNNNPLVKEILGRIDDYIYSPSNGKINLGNVSNTLKGTKGILKFKVIQNNLNSLDIYLIRDADEYNMDIEKKFVNNWRERVGNEMELKLHYVHHLSVEKSGKYRIIENNIKHLID